MSDGTNIVGSRTVGDVIAGQCTGPLAGTEIEAQDVNFPLTSVENDIVTIRDGNITVHGDWTFDGASESPTTTTPSIVAQRGLTCTGWHTAGAAGHGITSTGGSNGTQGGNGGTFTGGAGASGGYGVSCAAGAGSGKDGAFSTGDGAGRGATLQGGINGHGAFCTGGATSGHGCVGVTQDPNSAGLKGTAAAASGVAVWANGGCILLDTGSPSTPGANTIFADKIIAATGAVAITSAGTGIPTPSGSFLNCTVDVAPGDTTVIEVKFKTNMASGAYVVVYGEAEFSTPGTVYKAVTVQSTKSGGGFNLRMRNTSNGVDVDFAAVAGTWAFDFVVVGRQ